MALDFLSISSAYIPKKKATLISVDFKNIKSKDLMVRGGKLYAIWDDEEKKWFTEKEDAYKIIDHNVDDYISKKQLDQDDTPIIRSYAVNYESGIFNKFNQYVQQALGELGDNYVDLDSKLVFLSDPYKRENYSTKRLPYDIKEGPCDAYDELMSTLYSDEERAKIEWGIGSILAGDSGKIQKFFVLYGAMGTGKSTVINIIQMLFDGYWGTFSSEAH